MGCISGDRQATLDGLFHLGFTLSDVGQDWASVMAREIGLADLVIAPRSALIGQTVRTATFRRRYDVNVLAVQPARYDDRNDAKDLDGQSDLDKVLDTGDALLVSGPWREIQHLREEQDDFLVLSLPEEAGNIAPARDKAPVAIAIVLAMLVFMTWGIIPTVAVALLAALAMVLSGAVPPKRIYRGISWETLVLIAAMLPMSTALQKTGGVTIAADALVDFAGPLGPMALLIALFVITAAFSQIISNTATTVLIAPIAIAAAEGLGYAPESLLMTVAIAASAAFATPVASPVNTLVLAPGRYRFLDFVKVGLPLQGLVLVATVLLVPLLFPL